MNSSPPECSPASAFTNSWSACSICTLLLAASIARSWTPMLSSSKSVSWSVETSSALSSSDSSRVEFTNARLLIFSTAFNTSLFFIAHVVNCPNDKAGVSSSSGCKVSRIEQRASSANSSNSSSPGTTVSPMNFNKPMTQERIMRTSSSKHSDPFTLKSTSSKQNLLFSSNDPLQHWATPAINSSASIRPLLSSSNTLNTSSARETPCLNPSKDSNCDLTSP